MRAPECVVSSGTATGYEERPPRDRSLLQLVERVRSVAEAQPLHVHLDESDDRLSVERLGQVLMS
jgi:hypothetical protein